jgi:hypothetical protein
MPATMAISAANDDGAFLVVGIFNWAGGVYQLMF